MQYLFDKNRGKTDDGKWNLFRHGDSTGMLYIYCPIVFTVEIAIMVIITGVGTRISLTSEKCKSV